MGEVAQALGVQVGQVDESRPFQRGGGCEVDVVADEDDLARPPVGVEPAAAVGEDHLAGAGGGSRSHTVRDGSHPAPLVEVRAASQDQRVAVGTRHADRAHDRHVAGDGRSVEAGYLSGGDLADGLADEVRGAAPARAQDQGEVMAGDAGAAGDDLGGLAREIERTGGLMHSGHRHNLVHEHGQGTGHAHARHCVGVE